MHLIVGLGNPGKEHQNTRHNLGFRVIDELAKRLGLSAKHFKSKCQSFIAEAKIENHKVFLVQPQTFMNNSGLAVNQLLSWYKLNPYHLILIYDDVDLEVGQLRIRLGGGAGGHHGVESIISHIKTPEFARVRIGIGRESLFSDVTEYVLQNIPPSQKEALDTAIVSAAEVVTAIIFEGLAVAMNKFNK